MEITFTYIRNRIREHSKQDLLHACYNILDDKKDEGRNPIWYVFLLMKWTYLYGEEKYPLKPLTSSRLSRILRSIQDFNKDHVSNFVKDDGIDRALHILSSQQFYLQTSVYLGKFATQLKIYHTIKSKYNINNSFFNKTGLNILDFIKIMQLVWLYINSDRLNTPKLKFNGFLELDFFPIAEKIIDIEKVKKFLQLLILDPINPNDKIKKFKRNLKKEELQSLERTFFTLYPFQLYQGKFRLIHKAVFNYTINYYIYDYLKSFDEKFTTDFGLRLEKYFELGLKELKYQYINENKLKKILPDKSNLVDFYLNEYNIFIECKAIELQAYPSVNPTDDLVYNSLKDSIIKAYFKQLIPVSKYISGENENWGIILTYKRLFWSQFTALYELGQKKLDEEIDIDHLPPENVFIIDLYSWDRIVSLINNENVSLIEILKLAKKNNSDPKTKKQFFDMHLDVYPNNRFTLSYLKEEIELLRIKK